VAQIDQAPLWILFVLTLAYVFFAILAGMALARKFREPGDPGESFGTVTGATLGLLAFMLAFTFNMTANRFDARKMLLLDEVTAIGTAYLRAGLLSEPYTETVRQLLEDYVELRVIAARDPSTVREMIPRAEQIQDRIWRYVEGLAEREQPTVYRSLFIAAVNDMIDLQDKRVAVGLQFRVPGTIWVALYLVLALTMVGVGYQFGNVVRRQLLLSLLLATSFSAVMMLIVDLDRASQGIVGLNQQPLFDLWERLQGGQPPGPA
jgi:hypothetical protein